MADLTQSLFLRPVITPSDDMSVATINWLYQARARAGDSKGAAAALALLPTNPLLIEDGG